MQERRFQEKDMPCPKTGMSRKRDVNRKRPKIISFKTAMTSEKQVSGLGPQSCQQEGLSRFRDVGGRPNQEKVASSEKEAEWKKCREERVSDNQAVTTRRSGFCLIGSPFSWWVSPCWKLPARGLPGLYWLVSAWCFLPSFHIYMRSVCQYDASPSIIDEFSLKPQQIDVVQCFSCGELPHRNSWLSGLHIFACQ